MEVKLKAILLIVAGLAALVLASLWTMPVLVNLPDSLGGAIITTGLLVGGGVMFYKGIRMQRRPPSKEGEGKSS